MITYTCDVCEATRNGEMQVYTGVLQRGFESAIDRGAQLNATGNIRVQLHYCSDRCGDQLEKSLRVQCKAPKREPGPLELR
jgi:hypothetical protein